jgi:GNAT superfamily N-acetyltransferase
LTSITIRKATTIDIPEIVKQRRLMFEAMGFEDTHKLHLTEEASFNFFTEKISCDMFHGWVAVTNTGRIVCNAGLIIDQHPPGPNNLSGKIAYVFNLFTLPDFRRQGIARKIMQTILEWTRELGIIVLTLHATEEGENLYKSLGFIGSTEMYLNTDK